MALADQRPLAGKIALVTGGSRGIGAAISRKLGSLGASLYVNYVERDVRAKALRDELQAAGVGVELVKADVASPEEVEGMFARVRERHGGLDILVHNAASTVFRRVTDISDREWQYNIETNLRSLLLIAQQARPLLAGRGARLLTLSNYPAVRHVERTGPFGAAKAGIESLTRSLAVELAPDGVVVNCIRPGTVATEVLEQRPDFVPLLEYERRHSPWGKVTTVEDCANVVALLCLDEARWICGQSIVVDGGWSVWR